MDDEKRISESIEAERLMLSCWQRYVEVSKNSEETKELAPYVTQRMNPYRGAPVRKEALAP